VRQQVDRHRLTGMDARIAGLAANQHGLFTTEQVMNLGHEMPMILSNIGSGRWVVVRRGVYTTRELWESWDEWTQRPLARSRAAHLTMWLPHAMSHDSAALEHRIALLIPPGMVHVTRPDVRGSRTRHGVKHHGAVYHPRQVVERNGIPVLDPARTAVDIAREHGLLPGLVACDSAMQLGVTRLQLQRAVEPMRCWPGVTSARAAAHRADPGAQSPGETLTRDLMEEAGLGPIQTQFGLADQTRTAFCDLRVGRLVVEFDGRAKYTRVEAGGVATQPFDELLWEEKKRQDWVCSFRLRMERVTWGELWSPHRDQTKERLMIAFREITAMYGTDISDLAPYLIRRPAA